MEKYLFVFLLLFNICYAQFDVKVSGKLINQTSGEPISFAIISIQSSENNSQFGSQTLSDVEGSFIISPLSRGNQIITCARIGYDTIRTEIFIGEKNNFYDVGLIRMKEKETTLNEVTIESSQSGTSSDLDKKSFDLEDQIAQSGGSVLDALKGFPGITVDQDGNVLVRGSDKVMVLIDGASSAITGYGNQKGLENIPAANIARIEIINNPSAKYAVGGMAGVINLIPKSNHKKGWNGEAGFTYGLGQLTQRKPDLRSELGSYQFTPKYQPNLNVNYSNNKIHYFFRGSFVNQKKLPNNEFTTRSYKDGRTIASQVAENRSQGHAIVTTGLDWNLNKNNTFSISSIFDYEHHIDTSQIPYIQLETGNRNRYWHWKEDEVTGLFNVKMDYNHRYKEAGHKLNLSAQYTRGWEDEQYFLE